jgi:ubiquinone/menaquinone biosynthesis C-methylase UbiE
VGATPRYDDIANWYDETFAGYGRGAGASAAHLERLLGPGAGRCLDVGCGTGIHFGAIVATGRGVVGIDISAEQLRLAKRRATALVHADAIKLPFRDGTFDTVTSTCLHTDIDDIGRVFHEVEQVLRPGGRFVYIGIHPCFVGPFVEIRDEKTPRPRRLSGSRVAQSCAVFSRRRPHPTRWLPQCPFGRPRGSADRIWAQADRDRRISGGSPSSCRHPAHLALVATKED